MKKLILPVVAMLLCMTACKKEENGILRLEVEHYNSDAKMHIDDDDFAVWDNGDVVYLNGRSTSVSINGATATITVPSEVEAPYYASYLYEVSPGEGVSTYAISLPEEQIYSKNSAGQQVVKAPMAAYSTDGQKLKFRNLGSVLALEVKPASTITVQRIEVSANDVIAGQPDPCLNGTIEFNDNLSSSSYTLGACAGGTNTVTLTGINEQVTTAGKVYYIALPEVSNVKFTIKVYTKEGSDNDFYCYTRTQSGTVSFARNTIHAVPLSLTNATRTPLYAFTVNGNGKKVSFAESNLVYTNNNGSDLWDFGDNPWSCVANPIANNCDMFGWSNDDAYGKTIYSTSDFTHSFNDWGCNIQGSINWRTLSKDEWEYVTWIRDNNVTFNGENKGEVLWVRASIGSQNGVILFPDGDVNIPSISGTLTAYASDFTTNNYTESQWNDHFRPAGCVFLPAAGYYRNNAKNSYNTACYYWTSDFAGSEAFAFGVSSSSSSVNRVGFNVGCCVRLVRDRN